MSWRLNAAMRWAEIGRRHLSQTSFPSTWECTSCRQTHCRFQSIGGLRLNRGGGVLRGIVLAPFRQLDGLYREWWRIRPRCDPQHVPTLAILE